VGGDVGNVVDVDGNGDNGSEIGREGGGRGEGNSKISTIFEAPLLF
jgi:hypothetical protein